MREYALTVLVAVAVTYLVTPLVRVAAVRWGAMAQIRKRDVHTTPTPKLGGAAMFVGFLAAMLLASKLPYAGEIFDESPGVGPIILGSLIIVLLGIADDRWELDAPTKLAGQVLAAGVMAFQGVQVLFLPINGLTVLDPMSSVLITVLIVVVCINAVNFIDGLDGLAAGVVGIAAVAFFIYSYLLSGELGFQVAALPTLISAALIGICVGFLPHNFFRAKLFMGDTGSMLIGLLLASSVITLSGRIVSSDLTGLTLLPTLLPVVLPVIVLAIPMMDLVLAVFRRIRAGTSPFSPDKQHLHHRLLQLGHSQRRAVFAMYALTAVLAAPPVIMAFRPVWEALVAFALGLAILGVWIVLPRVKRRRRLAAIKARRAKAELSSPRHRK